MHYKNYLCGLLLALATTTSQAEDSGFYLGFSIGEATQNNVGRTYLHKWLSVLQIGKKDFLT